MIVQALAFYLFAIMTVAAAVMVVSARNPVHSVLFLILTFVAAAGLFLLAGAEFLALILIVVYVGAVAILFLFVVMMLDLNSTTLREGVAEYLPIGAVIGLILLAELVTVTGGWIATPEVEAVRSLPVVAGVTNTEALGQVIYTDYVYLFQASGLVLLVAMIGTIMLTHRKRPDVRKQVIARQLARGRTVEVKKVSSRGGI